MSERDKEFYVGYTKDLKKRLYEHFEGRVASTARRFPLKMVYYEACLNENDAIAREKYFKTGFGRRFLRNRMRNYMVDQF
jgi:putative endonuclease